MTTARRATAFIGTSQIAAGSVGQVACALRGRGESPEAIGALVFDDETGRLIDLDLRGSLEEVAARYPVGPAESPPRAGPGRPKLGVVSREISLLPRHWDWLASQPGGASVTLRKLVDGARKASGDRDRTRQVQEATYRFMNAMAGDLPGFEEALRALYAADAPAFHARIQAWPPDLRTHVIKLSNPLLAPRPPGDHEP